MTDYETIDAAIERIKRDRLSQPALLPDESINYESPADIEQRVYLEMHGQCQERAEVAFCKGMMVGGALALAVLAITLKVLGVL